MYCLNTWRLSPTACYYSSLVAISVIFGGGEHTLEIFSYFILVVVLEVVVLRIGGHILRRIGDVFFIVNIVLSLGGADVNACPGHSASSTVIAPNPPAKHWIISVPDFNSVITNESTLDFVAPTHPFKARMKVTIAVLSDFTVRQAFAGVHATTHAIAFIRVCKKGVLLEIVCPERLCRM